MINNSSLRIENLSLQRGDRVLLRGFNLLAQAGEAIELRGANGSGKTTLLRAIAGLHEAKSGKIIFSGNDEFENSDYIGLLSHSDAVKANEMIGLQLDFWANIFGSNKGEIAEIAQKLKISRLLGLMGGSLSAGQKRRVAIARLLLSHRPIWLLDEPAAPLDIDGRDILGAVLNEHIALGGIIIAAVHDALPIKSVRKVQIKAFESGERK